ncbi:bifunctional serine/threonine-protein kinase/ABC transporter substrate-binding protein [Streptomyces sp. NPDC004629]|uniref:bifunctional serine/threonine-protein kinase/ABC transporter substrate-binding protein n=1 Tax=Streptomyces sp. NPDC004629 TaxID=3364705 RepID=UPI0036826EAB
MRALTADDPATVGGHRLLARLGAGGMGVVYLARNRGGRLVALKVIRAEHAAEPQFRARFRREARLAARVRGRWVVPVTDADPEAREPWLATAFVPGPTLAEAVAGHGPLPARAVLILGQRIAEALADVHAAGLVHRDVKPGNIVLGRDGPHLIDFGIVRGGGATALTAPDAVIGTPGYLSPEQTRAYGDEVGPASDVFSLGCALVYAASGRPPYGGGDPATVLYRTVHEEPDVRGLDRLPGPARSAVAGCLTKDAARRPTAPDLSAALAAAGSRRDPRDSGQLPDSGDWLPPALVRLVAARAAQALDPPPRPPGAAAGPAGAAPEDAPAPGRRRFLAVGAAAGGVLLAGGAGAAGLLLRDGTGGGTAPPEHTIGLHGIGPEQQRGARLAVAAHNAGTGIRFRLALRAVAGHQRADEAVRAARLLVADPAVLAVLGPTAATAVHAAAPVYGADGLPTLLVSATATARDAARERALCVTRVGDDALGLPLSVYLTQAHPSRRTAVVEDLAAGPAGRELARMMAALPPGGGATTRHPVAAEGTDFRAAVADALATRPDAVVYAGTSPTRAASCARALHRAGFTGARVAVEPVLRGAFLDAAGAAADGWVLAAPYAEPRSMDTTAARAFTAAHRNRYGADPARWAAEAHDAVVLIARTLDALGGGPDLTRGQVTERLFRTPVQGVAKPIRFDTARTLDDTDASFLYGAASGRFHFLNRYDQITRPFTP